MIDQYVRDTISYAMSATLLLMSKEPRHVLTEHEARGGEDLLEQIYTKVQGNRSFGAKILWGDNKLLLIKTFRVCLELLEQEEK